MSGLHEWCSKEVCHIPFPLSPSSTSCYGKSRRNGHDCPECRGWVPSCVIQFFPRNPLYLPKQENAFTIFQNHNHAKNHLVVIPGIICFCSSLKRSSMLLCYTAQKLSIISKFEKDYCPFPCRITSRSLKTSLISFCPSTFTNTSLES